MFPWNKTTPGYVYLLHFDRPIGNLENTRAQASHYVGFAEDVESRLDAHFSGNGAKIVAAVVKQGIGIQVAMWAAPLAVEKLIKAHHRTSDFCPVCAAAAGRAPRPIPTAPAADEGPLPEFTLGKWDWMEGQITREWASSRIPAARDLALSIDHLI